MLGGTVRLMLAVLGALAFAVPAAALARDFEDPVSPDTSQQFGETAATNPQRQDTPNDPDYDRAEPDDQDGAAGGGTVPTSTNIFDERFDLFGFPSARTRTTAVYKDGPNSGKPQVSGFNAAGAWKLTRGVPGVAVAILDTGINWDSAGLRNKVALNAKELPDPPHGDADGNGVLSVDDYASAPEVQARTQGTRLPTGQDLIKAFSDGSDADGNGYVDDIAGWDYFDDDNDPQDASSYFAAANHGSARTGEAVETGNDRSGEIGVCPKCQFMPLRVWDTFVSDQNNFAMAITYATDNGAEVIEGADGGLYHSAFAEAATKYAYDKGVAQLYSGDDLNTGNHNFPAAYSHTQLVQGTAADAKGLGMDLPSDKNDPGFRGTLARIFGTAGIGTTAPVQTYFRGANTTQFGGKSSISMEGATGSTNTGKAAGAAALVVSAGRQADIDLSADETRELLEQTAEDILPLSTKGTGQEDPAQPGFDTHFGYGRVNLGDAVKAASTGGSAATSIIPPEASIGSPDWYAPVTGPTVGISGRARDRRHPGDKFKWTLEYGIGLAPTDFTTVRSDESTGEVTDFGTLPLDEIRAKLAARNTFRDRDDPAGPTLDKTDPKLDPYRGQFTVRLRVTSGKPTGAGDAKVIVGEDRKVLTALDANEQALRPGFPKRLGSGGEAPLRYADLNGDNVQEMVVPTEDGKVHAFEPNGSELDGWPVQTQTQFSAAKHLASPGLKALAAPREPPRAATVADVTGDGRPEVITAAGERIYAWDASGKELPGWPVRPDPDRANCAPGQQRKEDRHPKCGFLASPAIAHLEGSGGPLSIVVPGLDGRLRAYHANGKSTPNFPVQLIDPTEPADKKVVAESINNPAIGDLNDDGADDVAIATNEVYGASRGGGDVSFGGLTGAATSKTARVYVVSGKTGKFLDGWPIKPGGVIPDVLPLIGPGHDAALVKVNGTPQVVVSSTSGSLALYDRNGKQTRELSSLATGALHLFESAAVGDIDGDKRPDVVKYQVDAGQAANLLLVGQNFPYSHRIGAYDAATGAPKVGYPNTTDDYQFLSSSTVAKVKAGTTNQVLAGTGLGLLHAYDGVGGRDTSGFPKVTGGWLFAPAALSDDGRLAGITREGYLFEWKAPDAPACQSEWPSFRHDQQGTGNYDADGTPPAAPDMLSLTPSGATTFRLSFRSPGDDGFCGTATRYVADVDGQSFDLGAPVAGGSTFTKDISLSQSARRVTIRAADGPADGRFNLGAPGVLERTSGAGGGSGTGGGGGSGSEGGSSAGGGSFTPVVPSGAGKPAKPRLKVVLKYRKGHTRRKPRRTCANSSIRVTVSGADRRLVRRANLRLGRRIQADRRPPASKVFRIKRLRKTHLRRGKAAVRLKDGRLVRVSSRLVRICARPRRR